MNVRHGDQFHIAVYTAVKREISLKRCSPLIFGIVGTHGKGMRTSGRDLIGDIEAEFCIAAVMDIARPAVLINKRNKSAVNIQRRDDIDAAEFNEYPFAGKGGRYLRAFAIHSLAALIIVAAVCAVPGIPGVRQGHAFPRGVIDNCAIIVACAEFEFPIGIKIVFRPGKYFRGKISRLSRKLFICFLDRFRRKGAYRKSCHRSAEEKHNCRQPPQSFFHVFYSFSCKIERKRSSAFFYD